MKHRLLILLLGFLIEFLLISNFLYYNLFAGLLALIIIMLFAVSLIVFHLVNKDRKSLFKKILTNLTFGLFLGFLFGFGTWQELKRLNESNAAELISALGKYYKDNKQYPDQLDKLKNKYIDKVPAQWHGLKPDTTLYVVSSDKLSFMISIVYSSDDEKIYRSEFGCWDYYD